MYVSHCHISLRWPGHGFADPNWTGTFPPNNSLKRASKTDRTELANTSFLSWLRNISLPEIVPSHLLKWFFDCITTGTITLIWLAALNTKLTSTLHIVSLNVQTLEVKWAPKVLYLKVAFFSRMAFFLQLTNWPVDRKLDGI